MPRRVSVKGKGADIFFGNYTTPAPAEQPEPPQTDTPAVPDDSNIATNQQTNKPTKQPTNKRTKAATNRPTNQASVQELPSVVAPVTAGLSSNEIWLMHAAQPVLATTFRYSSEELALLEDVLHEVSKRSGVKLSKQEVARLALDLVLRDYAERGEASIIAELAQRKKKAVV